MRHDFTINAPPHPPRQRGFLARVWLVSGLLGSALVSCESRDGDRALFTEVTAAVGLDDSPEVWPDGLYRIPELSPTGIGLFDFDNDGDLDIYQVCHPPPNRPDQPAPNRLFQQQSDGKFVRVPSASGLADPGYGNGVAIGDVDNDGDSDVYVLNYGADALYVNNGDGTYRNQTEPAGIRGEHWSSCAAFFDYDRDGDLDLYVSHYVVDDPARSCRVGVEERRDYCGPAQYFPVGDTLYRNKGDGTFVDVTKSAGITQKYPGFGVLGIDLTGDGWGDVYVANDKTPNLLYVNQRDGTFLEQALIAGVAFNGNGKTEASMGVTVGDANGDGQFDLFMTHLGGETNTLFVKQKGPGVEGAFEDKSASSGLGGPSLGSTAWGCGFADFDNDGDLDLAVVNGKIARGPVNPGARSGPFWNDYAEPNQLFLNQGAGRFVDVSRLAGEFASGVEASRGLAFGDLDGDGDVDLVMSNIGNGLRVFRNDASPKNHHWLRVRAVTGKRDALGATVRIQAGPLRALRPLISTYSFQCASEAVAHFGLGPHQKVDLIEVVWPDGKVERFASSGVDRTVTLRQGEGVGG